MDEKNYSPIIVLGGDGYLGWPLALRLARTHRNRKIIIADNLSRRRLVKSVGSDSLTPIPSPSARLAASRSVHGITNLEFVHLDVNSDALATLIRAHQPTAIYHLAQQCSAPLSMRSKEDALMTLRNNEEGNMRLLWAVKDHVPDCHIIKLGTFGEYAKSGLDIAEGYFQPTYKGKTAQRPIPYPRQSDDIYHASKINDTNYISIACRIWGLRITDVMQSTIFGAWTADIGEHESLYTRLDYDEYYGTVVNRFLTQALCGQALTVYGSGHQRTGLMSLNDSVCSMAELWQQTPDKHEHRVINHLTEESFSINELATTIKDLAEGEGFPIDIQHGRFDPRGENESSKLDYKVERHHVESRGQHEGLAEVVAKTLRILVPYKDRINKALFRPRHCWQQQPKTTKAGSGDVVPLIITPQSDDDEGRWQRFQQTEFAYDHINLNPGTLGSPAASVIRAQREFENNDTMAFPIGQYGEGRKALLAALTTANALWPNNDHQLQISAGASQCSNILALNLVRMCNDKQRKLKVLTTPHEHIGGTGAFERLPEFEVSYLSPGQLKHHDQFVDAVADLRPDIVFFSHIAYDNAHIFPVCDWGRAVKEIVPQCWVLYDVSQSLGLMAPPLDYADVVFGSCHKWLFGPRGSGLMWTSTAFREQSGGLNWSGLPLVDDSSSVGFSPAGGMDFSIFAGVGAALDLHRKIGETSIRQRCRYLANKLQQGLDELLSSYNIQHRFLSSQYALSCEAGVITVAFSDYDPYPLYDAMNQRGVHCKCIKDTCKQGEPRRLLRFGVPFYETETRLEHALSAMDECIKWVNMAGGRALASQHSPSG
ncbi:aminotransferase class V-fold PLP-dependent enzyme [Zhongshania guokunii]|uniref:Aminotransferase class V-fold PLP-dependent enzyme n=1 Tax=Zhongshania guokunii TaxID=641783 RepID=A0ABV3U6U4_9GAMM